LHVTNEETGLPGSANTNFWWPSTVTVAKVVGFPGFMLSLRGADF
jgi:hypothetical protein